MPRFVTLLLLLLLTACAVMPVPTVNPEPTSTATPVANPPVSSPTPLPQPSKRTAIVDIDIRVADSDSNDSLVVDEVWLDGQIAYRDVSRFVLMLDGEYPAEMDGHEIRIKAQGYEEWTTRIRIRTKIDRRLVLPVHLLKVKPQS